MSAMRTGRSLTRRSSCAVLEAANEENGCRTPTSPRNGRLIPSPSASRSVLADVQHHVQPTARGFSVPTVAKVVFVLLLLEFGRNMIPRAAPARTQSLESNSLARALMSINAKTSASPRPQARTSALADLFSRASKPKPQPLRMTVFKGGKGKSLAQQQLMPRRRRRHKAILTQQQQQEPELTAAAAAAAAAASATLGHRAGDGASSTIPEQQHLTQWQKDLLEEERQLQEEEDRERAERGKGSQEHMSLQDFLEKNNVDFVDDCDDEDDCGEDVDEDAFEEEEAGAAGAAAGRAKVQEIALDSGSESSLVLGNGGGSSDSSSAGNSSSGGSDSNASGGSGSNSSSISAGGSSGGGSVGGGSGSSPAKGGAAKTAAAAAAAAAAASAAPYSPRPKRTYASKRYLSFSVCNGLTNQRISILSAALLAMETQRTLVVPRLLINGTQIHGAEANEHNAPSCDFGAIMDPKRFTEALAGGGLPAEMPSLAMPPPTARLDLSKGDTLGQLEGVDQEEHVYITCPLLHVPPALFIRHEPLVWAALEGMAPSETLLKAVEVLGSKVQKATGQEAYNVLHLRLESDWAERCQQPQPPGKPCLFNFAMVGPQLSEAGVQPKLPLLLVLEQETMDRGQYQAALTSLRARGYKPFVLKDLGGAHLSREQAAMVSYQLALRAEQFVGNAASTFSALLIMERLHAGKFAAYYNGSGSGPLKDFVPLHQLSDTRSAHAAADDNAHSET